MTLVIEQLTAGYGETQVLRGVDLTVERGELVALLGRNGVGKTTLANTVMGLMPAWGGVIRVGGDDVQGLSPHLRSRRGLALSPQGRRVFGSLTVEETLTLARGNGDGWSLERVYERFPRLGERRTTRARNLSGGEQSFLALARALATGPSILVLDEPSEGLSPMALDVLGEVIGALRGEGIAILLVEQNLPFALGLADRVAVMERGALIESVDGDRAREEPTLLTGHLAVAAAEAAR